MPTTKLTLSADKAVIDTAKRLRGRFDGADEVLANPDVTGSQTPVGQRFGFSHTLARDRNPLGARLSRLPRGIVDEIGVRQTARTECDDSLGAEDR